MACGYVLTLDLWGTQEWRGPWHGALSSLSINWWVAAVQFVHHIFQSHVTFHTRKKTFDLTSLFFATVSFLRIFAEWSREGKGNKRTRLIIAEAGTDWWQWSYVIYLPRHSSFCSTFYTYFGREPLNFPHYILEGPISSSCSHELDSLFLTDSNFHWASYGQFSRWLKNILSFFALELL